ncbi:MAG: hypothetical protein AAGF77_15055 [Bacteroidota bacterium]
MKNQFAKFQNIALTAYEQAAIKGGVEPVNSHLPEVQIPEENGIFYPCGLPVVSHP